MRHSPTIRGEACRRPRTPLRSARQKTTLLTRHRPRGETRYLIGLDRPGFPAVAHVPEHPLVTTSGAEVAADECSLGLGKERAYRVGFGNHIPHYLAELLAAIGIDPSLIPGIGGTLAHEFLAHFPVDPVAREYRADAFGVASAANGGEQVARIGEVCRGGFGGGRCRGGNPEFR